MKSADKVFDGLLVLQCKNGSKNAYSLLVKRWHTKFCKQAFWHVKNLDLAKDIAQDSWTVIFGKLDTLKDPNSFGSWALSIVNRKAIDALRKELRTDKKLKNYYEALKTNQNYTDDRATTNNDFILANDHAKIVLKAIYQLPQNQQVVLRLFYVEEYSVLEISDILKISKGTVKSRLFYAREKLKLILKNKDHEKS